MSKLPDGPKTPKWWQLIHWIANPFTFLDNCAQRYGDIFTVRLNGFDPLIFICNPQGIQEIFNIDGKQVDAGRSNEIIQPLVGSHSLLLMDGDRHKRERKLLMPPFHGERLPAYGHLISQITAQVAKQWVVGKLFIARTAMQEITLEVILQVVFGMQSGERYQQIKPLLATTLEMTASPLSSSMLFLKFLQQDWGSWSPWGRMVKRRQQVYDLLQAEINERRAKSGYVGNDILSLMMSARDENGQPMTDAELKDELVTLLVAGHETTATALAWAFYWLHKLPRVKEKLLQELESLGDNPEPMAIAQLPYLTAICLETLRIYPVVPITFGRTTKSPLKIMGYQFAADTMLAPCIYLIHHREDLYPEPKQFKPERFLKHQYSPYEYLPFGGGNRRCLGQALAMLEMKLVLATVLSRYQLALVNDKPITAKRRGLTLSPAGGVELVMTGKRVGSKPVFEAEPVKEKAML